jgi:ribosome biogenesis protein BRX1
MPDLSTREAEKVGKYTKKVKAKVRRKIHEMKNTLEPDEFAIMWKEEH